MFVAIKAQEIMSGIRDADENANEMIKELMGGDLSNSRVDLSKYGIESNNNDNENKLSFPSITTTLSSSSMNGSGEEVARELSPFFSSFTKKKESELKDVDMSSSTSDKMLKMRSLLIPSTKTNKESNTLPSFTSK